MGFVLSIIYFVLSYLTPAAIVGSLAQLHIELIIAVVIAVASLPRLVNSFVFKTPQSLALGGLAAAVFLSVLIGSHWVGGAIQAFMDFIPSVYAFFVVCLHFDSTKKLKVLVFLILFVCLFVITFGSIDLIRGMPVGGPPISHLTGSVDAPLWISAHPYINATKSETNEWIYRLRGLGPINDPNDFGQLLVCEIPLLLILWRPKKRLWNFACVTAPGCVLLTGVYLTHSRGALLALVAVVLVAVRRRVGTVSAVVAAVGLFIGAMALHFTGGRQISIQSGEDRTSLWSEGLTLVKTHPFSGVGFEQFKEFAGHTAHNSVVVCAAELGLIGFYFWCLFLLPTVHNALILASPKKVEETETAISEDLPFPYAPGRMGSFDKADANRIGRALVLSLTGFLVTGWFLSRAFVMSFFLLGGIVEVVYELSRRQGMVAVRLPFSRVLTYSFGVMVGLLGMVYMMLRIINLVR